MRLGKGTRCCCCPLPPPRRPTGAIPSERPGFPPKAGFWQTRRYSGKDHPGFARLGTDPWGLKTGTLQNCRDATGYRVPQCNFICIDAPDKAWPSNFYQVNVAKKILHKSPKARIFLVGRLHIRDKVENILLGGWRRSP